MDSQQLQQSKNLPKILIIGDSCEDIYCYGTCDRLSPEAPVPVLSLKRVESKPGMCLNVAKNLEGLGCKTTIITHDQKIKKTRYVEEKRLVHLLRVDEESQGIDEINFSKVFYQFDDEYDAAVISDYDKGFLSHSSCKRIVELLTKKNVPIFVDTKKQDLSCFENCTIKINQKENERIKKFPTFFELIVTLGENGAVWRDKTYSTNKMKLYDVCGAGDTFLSALVFDFIKNHSMESAIMFANKCASISVTQFGNYVLSKEDVL